MSVQTYTFRAMTPADLPLVNGWIAKPEVARWWDAPLDEADVEPDDGRAWIVSMADRPFAYIQDYDPHAHTDHHFAHLPAGSRGIDQFIGEPELLGRGHGSAFIRAHTLALFGKGAPAVGTDPHPDNARAIGAYAKAGFVPGDLRQTEWGLCLLMTRHRE